MNELEREKFVTELNEEYRDKEFLLKEMIRIFASLTGNSYSDIIKEKRSPWHTSEKFFISINDHLYVEYEFIDIYDEEFIHNQLNETIKITDIKIENF